MRALIIPLVLALCACSSAPAPRPREYLDEQTAATIKVVAEPLIFTAEPGAGVRDFLNVYAIDVNRMGAHRQYLAVLQWWPSAVTADATLVLEGAGQTLSLAASPQSARELGIAQAIDPSAPREAQWRYFPIDKAQLAIVASATITRATLLGAEQRVAYALWRDGRADVADLADDLP